MTTVHLAFEVRGALAISNLPPTINEQSRNGLSKEGTEHVG